MFGLSVTDTKVFIHRLLNVLRWVYIIGSFLLVCYASYFLFTKMNRPVAGLLIFLGGLMAALFYYVKWFMGSLKRPEQPVGLCPDFLTPVSPGIMQGGPAPAGASKTIYCMDFVGVSRNGGLKIADPKAIQTQMADTMWYSFPVSPDNFKSSAGLNALKTGLMAKGLTWVALFPDL